MRLFSYVVVHDSGFAPNPFWGRCTLAACKSQIRLTAHVGDWIVGLSPKSDGNRLVYAMRVTERMTLGDYFMDPAFAAKKPDFTRSDWLSRQGDNFYAPGPDGLQQLMSNHSCADGSEDEVHKRADLSGRNVLISDEFWYFGGDGPHLPAELDSLKVGRGHRGRFPESVVDEFAHFIGSLPQGVQGTPTIWPAEESVDVTASCSPSRSGTRPVLRSQAC